VHLYPRIPLPRARALLAAQGVRSSEQLRQAPLPTLDGAQFAPTGGNRVTLTALLAIRNRVDAILDEVGFPDSTLAARQRFDRDVMVHLTGLSLPASEMLRAEVWAWIAIRLVPHAVSWRFRGRDGVVSVERFAGSIHRNALGRLWLRSWVLDDATSEHRWSLATALTEDAAVALLERASLAADHRLARTIVRCWLEWQQAGTPDVEGLLRGAMKRIRVLVAMSEPFGMSDDGVNDLVRSAFVREHRARDTARPAIAQRSGEESVAREMNGDEDRA